MAQLVSKTKLQEQYLIVLERGAGDDTQKLEGMPIPTTPICYAYAQSQDDVLDTTVPNPGEAEGSFRKMLKEKEEEARFSPKDKRKIFHSGPL